VSDERLYNWQELVTFCTRVLLKYGLSFDEARIVSEHLVEANLRGVDTHGISRMGIYVERLKKGLVKGRAEVRVKKDSGVGALVDGDNGMGHYVAWVATKEAMTRAEKYGIAAVGVCNSNHCGMLAYYTRRMALNGYIGFAATNAPANMAPWGGRTPYLGTNPFSLGIPTAEEQPLVFDMATSVVSKGKIILAMKKNEPIPPHWATDKDGVPTTDPKEAFYGLVLPVGGPKGYGLALLVDILCGVLTGACFGPYIGNLYGEFDRTQDVGHFFLAFKPELFGDGQEFRQRLQIMLDDIRRAPRAKGVDRIYIPGEIEAELMNKRMREGIPLAVEIVNELKQVGDTVGVSFPQPWEQQAQG